MNKKAKINFSVAKLTNELDEANSFFAPVTNNRADERGNNRTHDSENNLTTEQTNEGTIEHMIPSYRGRASRESFQIFTDQMEFINKIVRKAEDSGLSSQVFNNSVLVRRALDEYFKKGKDWW